MYAKKKSVSMKAVALLLVVILLIGCTIGGTIAYLMTNTTPVVNTFVAGDIGELTLSESDTDPDTEDVQHNYLVIPGVDIKKDPKVSFSGHNVDAYVFLKVEAAGWNVDSEHTNFSKYYRDSEGTLYWDIADGWDFFREVDGNTHIYCRKVPATEVLNNVSVIKDDKITVTSKVTKENLANPLPNLTFTAYAIQASGYDAGLVEEYEFRNAAWAALNPPANDDEG